MPLVWNIDKHDAAYNTNAPFEYNCPLKLGNISIPPAGFLSIKIYCTEDMRPPVRLHSVTTNADGTANVEFRDSDSTVVGYWKAAPVAADTAYITGGLSADYVSAFIHTEHGVITGHVYCQKDIPSMLVSAAKAQNGEVTSDTQDFVLLPQCHTMTLNGAMRSITVNGTKHTGNVRLQAGKYLKDTSTGNNIAPSCIGKYSRDDTEAEVQDGVTRLAMIKRIDGIDHIAQYNIAGKHLIIKAGITSNIRVLKDSGIIILKGVADV